MWLTAVKNWADNKDLVNEKFSDAGNGSNFASELNEKHRLIIKAEKG